MVLIHLLSNHFLRRLMFRPARIGAAQAPGGRCVVGASLQVRLTRIGHWEPPAFVVCIVWVLLGVCLRFPIRAIRTKNTAVASLHLERIWSVLPCVIQRPPTSTRTSPANPGLTFCAAGP